jgi:hypothetical protein
MLRPAGVPTPCGSCEKVPAWARKSIPDVAELRKLAVELTPQNRAAWRFYRECRAVNRFPDDPVVRWYAALLHALEVSPVDRLTSAVSSLVTLLARR